MSNNNEYAEVLAALESWKARADMPLAAIGTMQKAAVAISALQSQVAALTAERDDKRRLFESCDAAHTKLTEHYFELSAELARVKALVADAPVAAKVERPGTAILIVSLPIGTKLIVRPNLEKKP